MGWISIIFSYFLLKIWIFKEFYLPLQPQNAICIGLVAQLVRATDS